MEVETNMEVKINIPRHPMACKAEMQAEALWAVLKVEASKTQQEEK